MKSGGAELAAAQLAAAVVPFTAQPSPPPDADSAEHRRASLALRLCRNLCAGQPAAREALKRASAPAAVNSLVRQIARQQPPPVPLLSIAMQMLCNLCVEDSEACEAVWCGQPVALAALRTVRLSWFRILCDGVVLRSLAFAETAFPTGPSSIPTPSAPLRCSEVRVARSRCRLLKQRSSSLRRVLQATR